ncbi:MAG: hypothetical protein IKS45_07885, partial [Thermoguttaceae bacterium]|nr:hypothetical protein [Thermoguttaceae bacterium]
MEIFFVAEPGDKNKTSNPFLHADLEADQSERGLGKICGVFCHIQKRKRNFWGLRFLSFFSLTLILIHYNS